MNRMSKIFPAGPIAAYAQGLMVVIITWTFVFLAWRCEVQSEVTSFCDGHACAAEWIDAHSIHLRYFYLLAAIGLIFAFRRYFESFSESFRRGMLRANPITPKKESDLVFNQLLIATICFGIATLQPPPNIAVTALSSLAPAWVFTAIWSGLLSTATAALGANAVAARRAL